MPDAPACSVAWDDAHLPAWGSAKDARLIIAVEVAGAWGRGVVDDAGLRPPKGAALYAIRRPGRHAATPARRAVIVSGGFDGEPWLFVGHLSDDDLAQLLAGDLTDAGHRAACGLTASNDPQLLVCTNGRRDACCAVRARPVALAAAEAAPDHVWEVSHIGGHKFAPTGILLPSGQTFGRLTQDDARALVTAPDGVLPAELWSRSTHRGRVDLTPTQRIAETLWREAHPLTPVLPPLDVSEQADRLEKNQALLPDGRVVTVTTTKGPTLPDSCGKGGKPASVFEASVTG